MWPNVELSPLISRASALPGHPDTNRRRIDLLNLYLQSLRSIAPDGPVDLGDAIRLWEDISILWQHQLCAGPRNR